MNYYRFTASTEYAGTDNDFYVKTDTPLTEQEINEMCIEYAEQNGESFEYLAVGWDDELYEDEEGLEQALEWYRESLSCECEEISKEEFEENA